MSENGLVTFLDYAGASRPSREVVDRQVQHLHREREIGGYAAANEVQAELGSCRSALSEIVGLPADLVAISDNSTNLWSRALSMVPFEPEDRVVLTSYEYGSNLIALQRYVAEFDLDIIVLGVGETGQLDPAHLGEVVSAGPPPRLISFCHAPSGVGTIVDLEPALRTDLGGSLVFVDACQSVGQTDVSVIGALSDVIVCSGRKFLGGPRGTAFAGISERFAAHAVARDGDIRGARPPMDDHIHVQSPTALLERWERSIAGELGLGLAACEFLEQDLEKLERRLGSLAGALRSELDALPGFVLSDPSPGSGSSVTFHSRSHGVETLVSILRARDVFISEAETYTTPLDLVPRLGRDVNRASVGRETSIGDVERFLDILRGLA